MNILALDTSMSACSVAALRDGGRVASRFERRERGHAEALFPMIREVMEEAGLGYGELTRIAVTLGPGSFTGVRAGVAAARGMVLAAGIEAVGLLSLDVMAEGFKRRRGPEAPRGGFAIAHDARRGELFLTLYDASGARISEPQALPARIAAGVLPRDLVCAAGSGAAILAEEAAAIGRSLKIIFPDLQPDAVDLLKLAVNVGPAIAPLTPVYLRPAGAEPQGDKMLARRGHFAS
jgi:tRNA threonylcarbamoyladenosine biosynthesis protein TsaB